tara:strand:- start:320 stop:982 length:663 start_codon:yes stop_codon:yes gene_type:complete
MYTNKIFNFSPSEFAFGFENCQRCYYDKKVHGIEIKVPFPGIFSKLDSLQKNYYHSKSSKLISQDLEEGEIVANYNKMLYSGILYDNKKRPFTMSGKIDGYIKHKNSFTLIDFKTTSISERKIDTYTTQLQSYALMMQKPRKDSLKLDPIRKLGIFCFDPSSISATNGKDCSINMKTQWFEIRRDDGNLIKYITRILEVLNSKEAPKRNPNCGICNFLAR